MEHFSQSKHSHGSEASPPKVKLCYTSPYQLVVSATELKRKALNSFFFFVLITQVNPARTTTNHAERISYSQLVSGIQ